MVLEASIEYEVAPYSVVPRPTTPAGDQKRDEFIARILNICGDTRLLYLPIGTETTTSTDRSRIARTITYDATVAARYAVLGSGLSVDFDGTDDEADTPDTDNLSFGNAVVDEPFGIVVLCKPDVNNALMTLLAKASSATVGEEYQFFLDASGHLNLQLQDESVDTYLEARYAAAVGTAWTLLGGTYDGSGGIFGLALFTDGLTRAIANDSSGSYVAMENGAALVHLGARYTTKEQFFNGRIALAIICAKALTRDDMWEIKTLVNAYFDLAL